MSSGTESEEHRAVIWAGGVGCGGAEPSPLPSALCNSALGAIEHKEPVHGLRSCSLMGRDFLPLGKVSWPRPQGKPLLSAPQIPRPGQVSPTCRH